MHAPSFLPYSAWAPQVLWFLVEVLDAIARAPVDTSMDDVRRVTGSGEGSGTSVQGSLDCLEPQGVSTHLQVSTFVFSFQVYITLPFALYKVT